jgi:APA family basic amino acid/polyamine antiporter
MAQEGASFKPTLGLLDATMIVAGSMIGSGIFIVSSDIARNVGSAGWLIFVWLLTGFMTLIAALSYGELSAMYPKAGGQYVYLKEAYNPLIGFLYGWSFFAVIQTGTIAAVGVAFSKFAAYIFPSLSEKNILLDFGYIQISSAQLVAILVVVLLSYINTRGVKEGKLIQTTFTLAKLLALFGLIIFGFILGAKAGIWEANWSDAWSFGKLAKTEAGNDLVFVGETFQKTFYENWPAIIGALSAAMVGSVFSSDAWNNVTFIAGEIKRPEKNIGLSLFFGTLVVTVIYVSANLMYTAVLPLNDIAFAQDDRVAVAASQNIFGSVGTIVIALMIMVSTFGCNNGLILSGARVYYTMAKDGLFFQSVGNLNKNGVPAKGLWIQCAWASVLCLSGKYGDLLDYVVFVVLIFYVLTIIGIFKLRRSQPDAERPYKAFGYPVLPACYILLATAMCFALLFTKPTFASFGLLIVLIGIPIYYIAVAGKKK